MNAVLDHYLLWVYAVCELDSYCSKAKNANQIKANRKRVKK